MSQPNEEMQKNANLTGALLVITILATLVILGLLQARHDNSPEGRLEHHKRIVDGKVEPP